MPANKTSKTNPALNQLEALVGEWDTEISEASFLPDLSEKITMQVSVEWLESGAFLIMRFPVNPPDSVWIIGRDDSFQNYTALYFDSRGVSRIYNMSFEDGLWKMWRESPNFSQRFEGKLSDDGNTIDARWEKSLDGKKWEHDFNLTYKRIKSKTVT
jgi:hypothetical protein